MTLPLSGLAQPLRGLARRPAFALLAIVTLALGIGAVTALFSVVDAVLLRPLPFRDPDRLVAIWQTGDADRSAVDRVAPGNVPDWRTERSTFSSVAAFGAFGATLTGAGEPRVVRGVRATVDYFATLGVAPLAGRGFVAADDEPSARVVVLSEGLWRERFGGDPAAIGSSVTLDGIAYTIVGVAPAGIYPSWPVQGPRIHFRPGHHDLWTVLPGSRLADRYSHVLGAIGRLAPGVGLAAASAAAAALAERIASAHPESASSGILLSPLVDEVVGDARPALGLLLGAAVLLLLVACANVGGLLVARGEGRHQELAVRKALGADRWSLVRRFFAEGLMLAAAGAVLGAVVAVPALRLFLSWVPREIPRLAEATVDPRALGVAVAAALAASLGFALVPLALERRVALVDALREGGRSGAGVRRQRLRSLLVSAQLALAVALAISATLLVESFRRLEAVDIGVATDGVTVVDLNLSAQRYATRDEVEHFYRRLTEGASMLPDVTAAHVAYDHPLETNWGNSFTIAGREPDPERPWNGELRFVTPGFFHDLEIPVVAGREFAVADRAGGRPVAVISRELARRFFGADDPLGATVRIGVAEWTWGAGQPTEFEIVGVVGDVAAPGAEGGAQPALYLDVWQVPMSALKLVLRSGAEPDTLTGALRAQVERLDPAQALGRVRTLALERDQAVAQPRFSMRLMTLFGALALGLAALGVYGLLAAWVTARTRELGLRSALGARPGGQVCLVLGHGLRLAALGSAAGVAAAFVLSRLLAHQFYGVSATDPVAFLAAPAAVLAVALAACAIPALRATRIDPAIALRAE